MQQEYLVYDKTYVPPPCGFNNIGAICWFNSLLQSLISLPAINRVLLDNEDELAENHLAMEMIKFLKKVFEIDPETGDVKGAVAMPPTDTLYGSTMVLNGLIRELRRLREKNKKMPNGQEGVQDYFNDFLELLNYDPITRLFNNKYMYMMKCEHCGNIAQHKDNAQKDTFIDMDCDRVFKTREEFCKWIEFHGTPIEYFICEKCKKKTEQAVRVQKLCLLREVVVIFYKSKWLRNQQNAWFPQYLQFSGRDGQPFNYKLAAQIEHSGHYNRITHTSSGHYYCHALRDRYYTFNDCSVRQADPLPTAQSTVLFYHMLPRDGNPLPEEKPNSSA
jgi:ubiquitin C-terminal hydrolase